MFRSLLFCVLALWQYAATAQNADKWLEKGDKAYKDGDFKTAIESYTEALKLRPGFHGFYYRGLSFTTTNQYDPAISDLSQAIVLDPGLANAFLIRGKCYVKKRNYDPAISDFTRVIQLEPNNKDAYEQRADALWLKKDITSAIRDYTRAIELDPLNPDYFYSRGFLYSQNKEFQRAIPDFNKALELKPSHEPYLTYRGLNYLFSSRYELAVRDFSDAILVKPQNPYLYFYRSNAYENLDRLDLALQDDNTVLQIDPNSAIWYNNRGLIYNRLGQYESAIKDFYTCQQKDPREGKAFINIISPLLRLQRWEEAASNYRQYQGKNFKSHLDSEKYRFYRYFLDAVLQVQAKQPIEALRLLDSALYRYGSDIKQETKRSFIDILFLKGILLNGNGQYDDALDLYEKSLSIDPRQPDLALVMQDLREKKMKLSQVDKTGPEISLVYTEVSYDQESGPIKTRLTGKVLDPSGISGLRINDQPPLKLEEDGLFIIEPIVVDGANTFTIAATDKLGNTSSKTFTINATRSLGKKETTNEIAGEAKYYAIMIASQEYVDEKIPDHSNPVKDARDLKQILESRYQFPVTQVDTLYDRSREDILQSIVQRCNTLTPNDNLIIFYAGHGTAQKDQFGDVDGYWIPVSARKGVLSSYISADDINKALKRSKARHILVIADACFSGAFTRQLPPDASKEIKRQYAVPSRKVMASGNLEPVPDNSKFLFYLKKSLNDNAEKYVSAKDIYDSFYKAVLNNTENLPQYAAIKNVGDEGGEFIFIRRL